ncbi:MAG: hypothetical protein WKG07_35165 [Hymenobacter sp.]
MAVPAATGVDLSCAVSLAYADGATASLVSTLAAPLDNQGVLYGTRGQLRLLGPLCAPTGLRVQPLGQPAQEFFAYPRPATATTTRRRTCRTAWRRAARKAPATPRFQPEADGAA